MKRDERSVDCYFRFSGKLYDTDYFLDSIFSRRIYIYIPKETHNLIKQIARNVLL